MKIEGKAGIRNRFDIHIQTIDKSDPIRNLINSLICKVNKRFGLDIPRWYKILSTEQLKAENIVLDAMWTRLVNFTPYFVNIHYGTGTGTLAATRTSLFAHRGTKTATTESATRALPTSSWVRKITLAPEEEVGQTLTEVGVAFGSTSTDLVTHALITDAQGNPISLTKTATQVVTIYATIFIELGAEDAMYGGKWRWVTPLANNELLSYLMGSSYPAVTFSTFPASGASGNILWVKDASNKRVTTPVVRLGTTTSNGYVRGFGLGATFRGILPITGVYASKRVEGEALGTGNGTSTNFNPVWGGLTGATPAVVYVAGTPSANCVVSYTTPLDGNILPYAIDVDEQRTGNSILSLVLAGGGSFPIGVNSSMFFELSQAQYNMGPTHLQGHVPGTAVDMRLFSRQSTGDSWEARTPLTAISSAQNIPISLPAGHRLLRIDVSRAGGSSSVSSSYIRVVAPLKPVFAFATPPASGAAITADYSIPYIPKDSNHVLDLQCAIQYGEIV